MKSNKFIATTVSVMLLAASSLSMARSLTAADYELHVEGYGLSKHGNVRANSALFENTVTAKSEKKGKGGLNGIFLSDIDNPGNAFGRLEHMPGNPSMNHGKPDHVPPANPPIDTPAFYNGLVNTPDMMPPSVPAHTLPGSGFGQVVVPVPAAVWLFGSGLLGLIGMARRRKQ